MRKEKEQLIYKKCNDVLSKSEEYMELQKKCVDVFLKGDYIEYSELVCRLQSIVERECYIAGSKDKCAHFCTHNTENNEE